MSKIYVGLLSWHGVFDGTLVDLLVRAMFSSEIQAWRAIEESKLPPLFKDGRVSDSGSPCIVSASGVATLVNTQIVNLSSIRISTTPELDI